MLKKTQTTRQEDWEEAIRTIEETVPKRRLDELVERTVASIRRTTEGKNAAYCWSGGKDSMVVQSLCGLAGISEGMLAVTDLEYPAFTAWVAANKPENLEIINTGHDIRWLAANQQMLFPRNSAIASKWFRIVQHRAQDLYFRKHNRDLLILGRRRADGNYVGANGLYESKGTMRYSPMADWTHEDILAYIHYNRLELAPFYAWKNGFLCSTHPWPARQWTESVQAGWEEVYGIDGSIVMEAAKHIRSAEEFLSGEKKGKP